MDFGELLHAAQRNEHRVKKESKKCYTTTFSAPKKEQKGTKSLSANIQKFLAKKEEEEKRKEDEAKKKRDDLLALRSQDGKAKKRVAAMLKRTKAANKSAIEDAVDDDNTAVTLDGPSQPDEDDYGYVSQEASAYYNKLMDKYNSAPVEEPLFSQKKKAVHKDLNSTKDRVRMALQREEEEEMMPHKRRRRSKNKKEDDPGDTTVDYHSSDMRDLGSGRTHREVEENSDAEVEPEKSVSKPKPKKAAPPTINFYDLLKLAEKKQFEPIKIEPKKKIDDEEDHRPMTKKQKLEYLKEQDWRQRKEEAARLGRTPSNQSQPPQRIPKVNSKDGQLQNQRSSTTDKNQERTSMGLQMKIPKINNLKREDKPEMALREERRPSGGFRRDERPAVSGMKREESSTSQKLSRQNGSLSRENSHSTLSKSSSYGKDDRMIKKTPKDHEAVSRMSRWDNETNAVQKSSNIRDESLEKNKSLKNSCVVSSSNASNRPLLKVAQAKQDNDYASKVKNSSGYDKKLQETIMAKMQECQRKKKLEETLLLKSAGRAVLNKYPVSKIAKDVERNSSSSKMQGKLPPRPERPLEQKSSMMNQKASNSSINNIRPPQEQSSFNSKSNTVPSPKPRVPPPEVKPKAVPSPSTKQMASSDIRTKPTGQLNARIRPPSVDTHSKPVPADARPKQVPPPGIQPKQVSSSDMRPKQFPAVDGKPRQFPPADVRPRQFPPPDVRPKQFPPPDIRKNPKPPAKRRIIDSEDEYDPEMDDFIDDGAEEEEDYSKHIREIFGYDRRKYSGQGNDEDECMESNFATILKEDFISTKTGIMEDLEDIRREKEMERRKKLAKKKKM